MSSRNLHFISWNVKGMNNVVKASKVLSHLQYLRGDLCFLQETHIRNSEISRIRRAWMGHLFHSGFTERVRGAAIVIHRDVAFEPSITICDPNGRFVIVSGKLQNSPGALASVYAPTWDDDRFVSKFFSSLPNCANHLIIIGGDFNLIQDTTLDRSSTKHITLSKSAATLKFHADQLGLADPWRTRFPEPDMEKN